MPDARPLQQKLQTKTRVNLILSLFLVTCGIVFLGVAALPFFLDTNESKIFSCEQIQSENDCIARISDTCQPIYGQNGEFLKCVTLTPQQIADRRRDREICSSTAGKWTSTRFGPYCECPSGTVYKRSLGCQ